MKATGDTLVIWVVWAALCAGVALRMSYLAEFPAGIHGDEAWTGLRGRDIVEIGLIGIWDSKHSVGQPAGTSYINAQATTVFGESLWSLRFPHALAAVIALGSFAVFARITLGRTLAAAVAITFYALADQEVLLGRVAYPPIWGQAFLMAALAQIALTKRHGARHSGARLVCAGMTFGLSAYFYPAPMALAPALILGLPFWLRQAGGPPNGRSTWRFVCGVTLVVGPMVVLRVLGLEDMPRGGLVFPRDAWAYLNDLWSVAGIFLAYPRFDGIDGTGLAPAFAYTLSILALCGVAALFLRKDHLRPLALLLIAVFVSALAFSAVFHETDTGTYRRAMAALVPAAWFAGYCLRGRSPILVAAVLAVGIAESGWRINNALRSPEVRLVYCEATTRTLQTVVGLNMPTATVYFASARHSWFYEIGSYLLPGRRGEDISAQFSGHESPLMADIAPGSIVALAEGYLQWVPEFRESHRIAQEHVVIGAAGAEIGHVFVLEP